MCGIAGYHFASEVASTVLDELTAYNAIVTGLRENKHRGGHASGFFAVTNGKTEVSKLNVDATQFINDVMPTLQLAVPTIVGVHTRAATKGDAKDNINNHPVVWGDVVVTHNGMIYNDEELKKHVKYRQQPEPEVDTAAISAVLNQAAVDPELEFDNVLKALSLLHGSFAIHAVWNTAPGYSLLARGTNSPLHVAYDDLGIFLYSSEVAGLKELQKIFGLRLDIRSFDPRTVLLLRDGVPVKWGVLPDPGENDTLVVRLNPGGKPWVESTRKQYYAAQGRPWNVADDENARLIMERGVLQAEATVPDLKTFANASYANRKLPEPIPSTSPFATLAEADQVFRFSRESGQEDTISAWFGNIELLLDDEGKLVDVFNWGIDFDRFEEIKLPPDQQPELSFDEWWKKQTSFAAAYAAGFPRPFQKADGTTTPSLTPFTGGVNNEKYRQSRADGLPSALFINKSFMGIQEVNRMQRCKRDTSIPVLLNERCPTHGQWTVNHTHPADCTFVQLAALAALDKASTITIMLAMTRGEMKLRTYSPSGVTGCDVHSWWAHDKIDVPIGDGKLIHVHIPYRDKCRDCDFVREVETWTPAVRNYLDGRKPNHVTV